MKIDLKTKFVNMTVLYVLIGIAFILISVMNIAAYRVIGEMSESYSQLVGNVKKFKKEFSSAEDELIRVIKHPQKKAVAEPLKKVTDHLEKARIESNIMAKLQPRLAQLENVLDQFRDAADRTFAGVADPNIRNNGLDTCRACVENANLLIDATDEERTALLKNRMGLIGFIYSFLLIGNFVVFGAIFFLVFINERNFKNKEKNLNDSNSNFYAIMQGLDSILITIDNQGKVLFWNDNAYRYFDYEAKNILGKNLYEMIPAFQDFKDFFNMVCNSRNRHYKYHERMHINKGPMRIVDILCVPIVPKKAVKRNIQLLLKMDDVTSFTTEADHLIRERNATLLSVGMENVMQDSSYLNEQSSEMLTSLNAFAAEHGLENEVGIYTAFLNNSLAQLSMVPQKYASTIQTGIMNKIQIDLNELVMYVLRICLKTFSSRINIEVSLNETKSWILADTAALSRALFCLLSNAAEAVTEMRQDNSANGGIISVSIEKIAGEKIVADKVMRFRHAVKESPYWIVLISDNGVGIPADKFNNIYDPFFTLKNRQEHKGLGLSVAVNIVNALGGFMDVNSIEGKGSVFKIYLPELTGVDANETSASSNMTYDDSAIVHGHGTILFVNDDIFMRDTTSCLLKSFGYDLIISDNGFEALDIYAKDLQSENPVIQCVLINMYSTIFRNVDMVKNLKAMDPNAQAVVMALSDIDDTANELKMHGVEDIIKQPYDVQELSEILAKYIPV